MFYYTLNETKKACFCFFTDGKHHKAHELDMITAVSIAWLPVTLSVLDTIAVKSATMTSQVLISKIHCTLSANQKRDRSSMYNNQNNQVRRMRLITLTETLIILDITKTESNNCAIIHWREKSEKNHVFPSSLTASNTNCNDITLRDHPLRLCGWRDYPWPWVSLTIIVYNLQQDDITGVISNILRTPSANPLSSMYDNQENKANIGYFRKNVIICLKLFCYHIPSITHSRWPKWSKNPNLQMISGSESLRQSPWVRDLESKSLSHSPWVRVL